MSRRWWVCVRRSWEKMRMSSVRWGTDGAWLWSLWLHCSSLFHCGWPCIAQPPEARTVSEDPRSLSVVFLSKNTENLLFSLIIASTLCYQLVMNLKNYIYIFLHMITVHPISIPMPETFYVLHGTILAILKGQFTHFTRISLLRFTQPVKTVV